MREVAADTDFLANGIAGAARRARLLIVEADGVVSKITDGLNACPTFDGVEIRPGKIRQDIGIAVTARQQKLKRFGGQFIDFPLAGVRRDFVGFTGVEDQKFIREGCFAGRQKNPRHVVAKCVADPTRRRRRRDRNDVRRP